MLINHDYLFPFIIAEIDDAAPTSEGVRDNTTAEDKQDIPTEEKEVVVWRYEEDQEEEEVELPEEVLMLQANAEQYGFVGRLVNAYKKDFRICFSFVCIYIVFNLGSLFE